MLISVIVMTYTGIALFIAPPGRVAHWANWEILALTKEQYAQIHSTMMLLFVIATILHIYYNFKPITSYMKNKAKKMVIFTKDMLIATIITALFIIGTLFDKPPFSTFLNFGEDIKDGWEEIYSTAPYPHAELSSLKSFCNQLGFDLNKSEQILKSNNINFDTNQTLSEIGKQNSVSPQFIYTLLKNNLKSNKKNIVKFRGLGKKTIKELASTLGVSSQKLLEQLETLGIKANENDKFKDIVQSYNKNPMDIMIELGY